ncbi:16S rRNA (guanine(966)-N(2))-methyltransferase RsmD [Helicobacter anatolicus]|uniref:16S rRNA (guanine(966)-N(2))-methyltransferase RsmD n=1 Tax=Helicobacter anatolicus TaxID=2905874 RepID=UPI001E3E3B3D|nr:16S rRNA (guanine(966)-N(2))-methyltransferase RsmD [Helicobacter anatolicus]MCE3036317.1 16S rRNA (guanine(966)-N(2))-methyltransferase RsmD [Helicobacter anatolicus]MCE3039269.1 16S rRNA (guanine(966)-N(2))-methyltransferase RsmD [Helicobacter anatolicus]
MNHKSTIRVISGLLKGHSILMPKTQATRSSKAILKESLFNTLNYELSSHHFVEVFAGTGSIAIEALSRGVQGAICIEKDKQAFEILQQNTQNIKKKFPHFNMDIFFGDSFILLPQIIKNLTEKRLILFFDPPFPIRENFQKVYEECFLLLEKIPTNQELIVIFEHFSNYKMPQIIKDFSIIKSKKFGKSSLSYYTNTIKE